VSRARRVVRRLPLALAAGALLGCNSGPRLQSPDLTLVAERPSQQRPSVTSLALNEDGSRLAVGDFVGQVALLDVAEFRRGKWAEPGPQRCSSRVLALGARGSEVVAVPSRGAGIGWQPAPESVHGESQFSPLSGALVTPALQVVDWSFPSRTLSLTASPGGATTTLRDVRVAAADAAGDRVALVRDRPPENGTLELRSLPALDLVWAIQLGHPATGVALDPAAGLVAVSSGSDLELRALADGALRHSVAAPGSVPVAFRDGARLLLVRDESLAVLHFPPTGNANADPPRIVPAFLAHRGGVGAVAFSADARWLATGGARGDLLLFSVAPPTP
jgi:WD40 repeat protein